jgi:hypothetical protein
MTTFESLMAAARERLAAQKAEEAAQEEARQQEARAATEHHWRLLLLAVAADVPEALGEMVEGLPVPADFYAGCAIRRFRLPLPLPGEPFIERDYRWNNVEGWTPNGSAPWLLPAARLERNEDGEWLVWDYLDEDHTTPDVLVALAIAEEFGQKRLELLEQAARRNDNSDIAF